ncbi:hypothetical protein TNCV_2063981 [Trichonephila clavipes]|nr:hypothetical protein TNCV_2063981 [Trichonephila clavipes]
MRCTQNVAPGLPPLHPHTLYILFGETSFIPLMRGYGICIMNERGRVGERSEQERRRIPKTSTVLITMLPSVLPSLPCIYPPSCLSGRTSLVSLAFGEIWLNCRQLRFTGKSC